jgi:hypothetical protein
MPFGFCPTAPPTILSNSFSATEAVMGDGQQAAKAYIERWANSGAAERANGQIFLAELCALIGAPPPDPATPDTTLNAYVFERSVTFHHGNGETSPGRIDLYKRGCFVLEAKQGADASQKKELPVPPRKLKKGAAKRGTAAWDDAMLRARGQTEQYIRALPAAEGRPPFLVVVDVGESSDFVMY